MKYRITLGALILRAMFVTQSWSHPGHTNKVLLELNDYMMAIQVMRTYDPRAEEIFGTWQSLREASWKIRELTDEDNLSVTAPGVMDQIAATRDLQKKLHWECLVYFEEVFKENGGIEFTLGNRISVQRTKETITVPVDQSRVGLIKITNVAEDTSRVTMTGKNHDQLLFWNKIFDLGPGETRFTYYVIAPLLEQPFSNEILVSIDRGPKASAIVRGQGATPQGPRYTLLPAQTIYQVKLPTSLPKEESRELTESISFDIRDAVTNEGLAARVEVSDNSGQMYWSPLLGSSYAVNREDYGWNSTLWKFQPGPYFYVDHQATLGVTPAGKSARIYHGFEYKPLEIKVPESGQVKARLERWIDMPKRGWYSGHTHIHTTDAGMPVQFTSHWPMVSRAEGLNLSAILTLKGEWETHAIYANEFPVGVRKSISTEDHIITYGQEYRSNPYGHLAFLGLDYLIMPISSGALGEMGGPDYPPNSVILDEALDQGAITIGAHFGNFISEGKQIKTPWPSTGFEMPTDVALGKMQLAEVYGAGGQLEIWYDLLNCGFKLPATAGPDWAIKDTPRVYAFLGDSAFNERNWIKALQAGRSFITRGPMLFFKVNDQMPGTVFNKRGSSASFRVQAEALALDKQLPVEIVFNGEVIETGIEPDFSLEIKESGWLAARCDGAHSNPVYIEFDARPAGQSEPALKFIAITERIMEWVNTKGLYDNPTQKAEVLKVLSDGIQVFREIVSRAGSDN